MVQDPALGRALKESASGIVLVPWPWGLRDRVRAAGRCPSCPTRDRQLDSTDGFATTNSGHVGGAATVPEMSRDGVAECGVVDTRRGYRRHGLGGTTRPVRGRGKRAGKGVQLLELTIRPAVTEAAPELVEDNWAHEEDVIVVSCLTKTRERRGIPAEDLTDDIRVEDEARRDKFHDEPDFRLPMPARYVVDRVRRIRAADVNPDYTMRPEPKDTVAVVRQL